MWIIAKMRLQEYWRKHPGAKVGLEKWFKLTGAAKWKSLIDVRRIFPHADLVTVKSGNTVIVFNVGGGNHRMITSIHYNTSKVYVVSIMTHAEYNKNKWKVTL